MRDPGEGLVETGHGDRVGQFYGRLGQPLRYHGDVLVEAQPVLELVVSRVVLLRLNNICLLYVEPLMKIFILFLEESLF